MTTDQPTIHAAMAAAMNSVRSVAKRDFNDHQKFSFRGVDAVVNAVGPVFREHGIVVVPKVQSVTYDLVQTSTGKPSTACRMVVDYVFYGPAGDSLSATVAAESWDNGDKSAPKCMSVAFRTALLQTLTLPTDEPDPDSHTYERAEPKAEPDPLLEAKTAVADAWRQSHGGAFDRDAMQADYEQWAAAPLADAEPEDLLKYARALTEGAPLTESGGELAAAETVRLLAIAMSRAGITEHDHAIKWVATVVERPVESRNDLTPSEATKALAAAKRLPKKAEAPKE